MKNPKYPENLSRRLFLQASAGAAALAALPAQSQAKSINTNARVVIVGAGAAGISLANRLARQLDGATITLAGARQAHLYQPGYTLIGSGLWPEKKVQSTTDEWLLSSINWVASDAEAFDPERQVVRLMNGEELAYDILAVATGCQLNYDLIEGMSADLIGKNGIGSVYAGPQAASATNSLIENLVTAGSGRALFTLPHTALKCAGAPIKMTFTTLSRMEDSGNRDGFDVNFMSPNENRVFGVPFYNEFVLNRFQEQRVALHNQVRLTAIDANAQIAYFSQADGTTKAEKYDFIHVVPPMSAPDAIKNSDLVWQEGGMAGEWLEVDQYTLQHRRYDNIFGVGDVAGTPFGKTAASVKMQVPTVEANIINFLQGQELSAKYNGYTSCPLITGIGKAMLAEFGYGAELMPSFAFIDPKKESWAVWVMKEKMLQPAYYAMLRGRI